MNDEETERVDRLNELPLHEACRRFVELGAAGVFMTCNCDSAIPDYRVYLKCKSLKHAQQVHRVLIEIVSCVRDGQPAKPEPTRISG